MAAAPATMRSRRSWQQRLVLILSIFVAVSLLAGLGAYGYLRWRYSQINKVSLGDTLQPDDPGQVMNVLLVGSDSRTRISSADAKSFCEKKDCSDQAGPDRSDTIMVLHVDPRERKAAILSVPRDLYVHIAGTNRMDRINSAFNGGPQRLISTIEQNLGVQLNHYVEVDFVGFKSIVDSVGGVQIYVPAPARDKLSGLDIKNPGCVTLDGKQGLAWARSRHYEYFEAGRWHEDPRGDLGRIQRQQDFIRRMLNKAVASGLTNPLQLNRLVGIGVKNVTIDSQLSTKDIYGLARKFRSLNPETVDMLTVPVVDFTAKIAGQDAQVLKLKEPDAQSFVDRINGRSAAGPGEAGAAAPGSQPTGVRVRILNGTGTDGLAARVSQSLQQAGFNIADRGDADRFPYPHTMIKYDAGSLGKAQLLQRYLQGGAQLQEDTTLRTVDVVLLVGSDFTGVRPKPAPGPDTAASTPTTVGSPTPAPQAKGAPPQPAC